MEYSTYPEKYIEGLLLYQQGKFWESHEFWEDLWRDAEGIERHFYQGLIQLDAALLHTRRGHWAGVQNLLKRSLSHLKHSPETFLGIDVKKLRVDLQVYLLEIEAIHEGRKKEFDWALSPVLSVEGILRDKSKL